MRNIYLFVRRGVTVGLAGLSFCVAAYATAGDPVGWRKDGTGHFKACEPPSCLSGEEKVVWKVEMPGQSLSSPIVVGEQVFTMAEPSELICINASDGKVIWKRSHNYSDVFPAEKVREIEAQHAVAAKIREQTEGLQKQLKEAQDKDKTSAEAKELETRIAELNKQYDEQTPYPPLPKDSTGNTTSTPVSDGELVWAAFATGIVSAHTLDGERKWMQFIEKPNPRHTASPILAGGRLIIHLKNLIALDAQTGSVLWRAETPSRCGTPVVAQVGDKQLIVTPAGGVVQLDDGKLIAENLFNLAYCSPIVHEGVIYAIERGRIKAIQLAEGANGNLEAKPLWESRSSEDDYLASPVVHQGLLYTVTGKGILEVTEIEKGERVYRKRLDLDQGRADPSLALAGEQLFVCSTGGATVVVKPGREFEEISRSNMEGFSSSPFFHADRTYIRTAKHLHCIRK